MRNHYYWTLDKILQCAERCRTYWQFCKEHPLAYQSARRQDYLPVVRSHCGWTPDNGGEKATDLPPLKPLSLKDVVEDHGSLLIEAFDDPRWPIETDAEPLKAELL